MRRAAAGPDLSPKIARVQRWRRARRWPALRFRWYPLPACSPPITLSVDACPVKSESIRLAERFIARGTALKVVVVSNAPITVPYDRHS
jgi:hypothetical protein